MGGFLDKNNIVTLTRTVLQLSHSAVEGFIFTGFVPQLQVVGEEG